MVIGFILCDVVWDQFSISSVSPLKKQFGDKETIPLNIYPYLMNTKKTIS